MSVKIIIPTPLRRITGELETVEAEAGSLNDIVEGLEGRYPGLKARLCDDGGALRRFINIYVDGEDVRFLDSLATRVPDGAEISIVPAIAGGSM
jgi:molybdopterin synthase sulfur carrier subunit